MFFLYSLLLTIGFLFLLPRFLFQKKYAAGFRERFGNLPDFDAQGKPVVWLHCVSVGETQAARPLVAELLENFPEYKLVVSTTTLTGQTLAGEIFREKAALVFYFPFDWKFSARRALNKIKPDIILLMETEIWFNFLREAGKSGAKTIIVNGRLSEKSANRYKIIRRAMRRVLRYVDLALMQTGADAQRLLSLGIRSARVKVTGNIKFDQPTDETESELTNKFRERFQISEDAPLIVAASTHAPEEEWILDAFKNLRENFAASPPRLLIAPRHPERFDEVSALVKKSGFDYARRSENESANDRSAEIILLDSIGELRAVYPLAEIVFVGGSLIPHGGQNILEPAAAQKAIVTGFYTTNFEKIVEEFLAKDALIQLPKLTEKQIPENLFRVFAELLNDAERRETLAENAFGVMRANRGASRKTIEFLKPIFQAESQKSRVES
ncbi:MAG: 3-deoxy-D-manno-octulosonic acid transferase [Pyrinomonadaceae bacterium]